MSQEWHVGQEVAVLSGNYDWRHIVFQRVAKVTTTSVTLDDGSRWTVDGRMWGESKKTWRTDRIEPRDQKHAEELERQQEVRRRGAVANAIHSLGLRNIPADRLERALAILRGEGEDADD